MKRGAWLVVVAIAAVGCQNGESTVSDSTAATRPRVATVAEPATLVATDIGLVVRHGQPITVGFSSDTAFRMFRDPKQATGFEYDDLPPKFQWPYKARTWEEAHMGFGEILYNGQLVAAMYQEDRGNQDRVDELVREHKDQVNGRSPTMISGKHVTYWFWEKEGQRLMICAYPSGRDIVKITVAMGDDVVMDALGIAQDKARKDQLQVDMSLTKGTIKPSTNIAPHG